MVPSVLGFHVGELSEMMVCCGPRRCNWEGSRLALRAGEIIISNEGKVKYTLEAV